MTHPEKQEKQRYEEHQRIGHRETSRRPFDTSEIDRIPGATDDDPPYRNWWVVDDDRVN